MNQKKNTILSYGEELRRTRESHGASLERAAKDLHVPINQLQALEEDRLDVFSAPVYAHGALHAYARWLGIDDKKLSRQLSGALREQSPPKRFQVLTFPRWYERLISGNTVIAAGVLLAVLAVGSYVIWQVSSFWRLPDVTLASPVSQVIDHDVATIAGRVEEGGRIKINEETVMIREDSSFEQIITLSPGITIVRIEAENAAGRVRVIEKHLLRPRNGGNLN